jgi:PilZ domain-containing protein
MDRLREFSIVTLSLPDSARVSEFKAYVIGVHRQAASLQPVERGDAAWIAETVGDVLMSFAHGDQTVGLKGELRRGSGPDDLRFRVTDGVCLPRRRSSRLKLCAPASVTPLDGGAEIVCQTQDVGPDGLLLEGAAGLRRDQMLAVSLMLPENPDAVCAQAIVTDVGADGLSALEFVGLERDAQRVLSDFVTEHFRRRLNIVRSLREEAAHARD